MYSAGQHMHYDISQYYTPAYAHFAPSPYPERTLKADRRRPKYTRSKTGCLTCRKKKVKVRTEPLPRLQLNLRERRANLLKVFPNLMNH